MKYALTAAAMLMVSCSVFQPREPEAPDPNPGVQWQDPIHPTLVLANLQNSLGGLSVNFYSACFHENFTFEADPLDVSDPAFSGLNFSDWGRPVEVQTVSSIIYQAQASGAPRDSLASVFFMTNPGYPGDSPVPVDSTTVYRDYFIVAAGTLGCGWDRPSMGKAVITMVEDEFGLWSIIRWEDNRVSGYTGEHYTWGVAKALYR